MELHSGLKYLEKELKNKYGIPVIVTRGEDENVSIVLTVKEIQTRTLNLYFKVYLEWRRLKLVFEWPSFSTKFFNVEKWHDNLIHNPFAFDCFLMNLKHLRISVLMLINGKEFLNPLDCKETWEHLRIEAKSNSYLEVINGETISFDVISKYVVAFWGFILSIIGDRSIDNLPLEGEQSIRTISIHERNPINREACLSVHDNCCVVCGANLNKIYGESISSLLEVHHIEPISNYEKARAINPAKDLVPVCPNCHSIIHKKIPPYTIEEVKNMLKGKE